LKVVDDEMVEPFAGLVICAAAQFTPVEVVVSFILSNAIVSEAVPARPVLEGSTRIPVIEPDQKEFPSIRTL
jgi:hypothetical protein